MRISPRALVAGLTALALVAGCGGGGGATTDVIPPESGNGLLYQDTIYPLADVTTFTDVVYSTRPNPDGDQYTAQSREAADRRKSTLSMDMDIYVPPNASANSLQPLVVFVHGGGFVGGDKEDRTREARTYARAGYVAATINYRLTANPDTSEARRIAAITDAVEDLQNAIRFLKTESRYRVDPTRVAVIGTSAGGGATLINAVQADELDGAVSDFPGVSAKANAAASTGATLFDKVIPNSIDLFRYDADDTPVLLLHARPRDGETGATWDGEAVPTCNRIASSGNTCTPVPQANGTHTVDMAVNGPFWAASLRPFLLQHLNL